MLSLVLSALSADVPWPEARERGPVELAGSNVIHGARSGYVNVRIPRPVELDIRQGTFRRSGPNPAVTVSGRGTFVGIMLTTDRPNEDLDRMYIAGRISHCPEDDCTSSDTRFNYVQPRKGSTDLATGEEKPRFIRVPPGNYRLYLLTSGSRAKVILRVKGLQDHRVLKPDHAAHVDSQALAPRLGTGSGDGTFAAGATFQSGASGYLISQLFLQSPDLKELRYGLCLYNGPAPPPDQVSYGPHCTALALAGAGAGHFATFNEVDTQGDGYFIARLATNYDVNHFPPNITGERGLGAWYNTPSDIVASGAQGIFISFDTGS